MMLLRFVSCWIALVVAGSAHVASAQSPPTDIVVNGLDEDPGTSIQPPTTVILGGTRYTIGEDQGDRMGQTLLQSFERFTLGEGDEALFTADLPTDNIVARVTGGDRSEIWGRIRTDVSADLYFLNPAGILFGETATLDVQGSFAASTANLLRMETNPGDGVHAFSGDVSVGFASPTAFGFTSDEPASIRVEGADLSLSSGLDFSLVGGDIQIGLADESVGTTNIDVVDGRLALVAAGGQGDVEIEDTADGPVLSLSNGTPGGRIDIDEANLVAIGSTAAIAIEADRVDLYQRILGDGPPLLDARAGARTHVRARRLSVDIDGAETRSIPLSMIRLTGEALFEVDQLSLDNKSRIGSQVAFDVGEDIVFRPREDRGDGALTYIRLDNQSLIEGDANAGGVASDIFISGYDEVVLDHRSEIRTDATGPEALTGNIVIDVDFIRLSNRSEISSSAFDFANTDATQLPIDGGSIEIRARNVELLSGGAIETISVGSNLTNPAFQGGNSGDIRIEVEERLLIDGAFIDPPVAGPQPNLSQPSGITSSVLALAEGGDIEIDAGEIVLRDGGRIASEAIAEGQAGSIEIEVDRLEIEGINGALEDVLDQVGLSDVIGSTSTTLNIARDADYARSGIAVSAIRPIEELVGGPIGSGGQAGSISIDAGEVHLGDGALIAAFSQGVGDAGNIEIDADVIESSGAEILSDAQQANAGGNITLEARVATLQDSRVATSVATGDGNGGDIALRGSAVAITQSILRTSAEVGDGGDIDIEASGGLIVSQPVQIGSASDDPGTGVIFDQSGGPAGVDGLLTVQSPEVDLEGGLSALEGDTLDASRLIRPACDVDAGENIGRFEVRTRGLSAAAPDDVLVSEFSLDSGTREAHDTLVRGVEAAAERLQLAGRAEQASEVLARGVAIVADEAPELSAKLLNNLGNSHSIEGKLEEALRAYERSAEQAAAHGDATARAQAIANAARTATRLELADVANQHLATARAIVERGADATNQGLSIRIHLARTHHELAGSEARARHLLDARELLDSAAAGARSQGEPRLEAYAWLNLAEIYHEEGHHGDSLALASRALDLAEVAGLGEITYRARWLTGRNLWRLGQVRPALAALRLAVRAVEDSRQEVLARAGSSELHFRNTVAPIYRDFVDALLQSPSEAMDEQSALHEARHTLEQLKAAELRDYFHNPCVAELEARATDLSHVSSTSAVVYPVVLPDRIELLLGIGGKIERVRVPIEEKGFTETVLALRSALSDPRSDSYRVPAASLYDWLIAPVEKRLQQANIDTLVFVPGGIMRTIPMAALFDGEEHLVERYALAVTPSLRLIDPAPINRQQIRVLAAGISQSIRGSSALPKVTAELEYVEQTFGVTALLDEAFEVDRLRAALEIQKPSIVHLASHGYFTGDPETSYILAYDKELTMGALADVIGVARFRDEPLELLVMSACQTAAGDERASLGLAGIAVRAGARSVIGSLWNIADDAAYDLVRSLYRELQDPRVSRAEALRRAQLELMENPRFAHPYYWSPFLVISDWL